MTYFVVLLQRLYMARSAFRQTITIHHACHQQTAGRSLRSVVVKIDMIKHRLLRRADLQCASRRQTYLVRSMTESVDGPLRILRFPTVDDAHPLTGLILLQLQLQFREEQVLSLVYVPNCRADEFYDDNAASQHIPGPVDGPRVMNSDGKWVKQYTLFTDNRKPYDIELPEDFQPGRSLNERLFFLGVTRGIETGRALAQQEQHNALQKGPTVSSAHLSLESEQWLKSNHGMLAALGVHEHPTAAGLRYYLPHIKDGHVIAGWASNPPGEMFILTDKDMPHLKEQAAALKARSGKQ